MRTTRRSTFRFAVGGVSAAFTLFGAPAFAQDAAEAVPNPARPTATTVEPVEAPRPATPITVPTPSGSQPPTTLAPILDGDSAQFSFQARLTDNMGNPLPGPSVNLTFQLYTGGGAALGAAVVMNNVSIADGIVDLQVPFNPADFDGTAREIGVRVNAGAELAPRLQLGAVPYAYRVNRVTSEELDDGIELGESGQAGYFAVYGGGPFPKLVVEAAMGIMSLVNDNNSGALSMMAQGGSGYVIAQNGGEVNAYMSGSFGEVWSESSVNVGDLNNNLVNTVHGRMSSNSWGGMFQLWDEGADTALRMGASSSTSEGGFIEIYRGGAGGTSVFLDGEDGNGNGLLQVRNATDTAVEVNGANSQVLVFGTDGDEHARLGGTSSGVLQLRNGGTPNNLTVNVLGSGTGGQIDLSRTTGTFGVRLQGGTSSTGGLVGVHNASAVQTVEINGDEASGGGSIMLRDGSADRLFLDADANRVQFFNGATETLRISGNGGDGAGVADIRNSAGITTIELDGHEASRGIVRVRSATGGNGVTLDGGETSGAGAQALLYNSTGQNTIEIDADNGNGDSFLTLRRTDGSTGISMNSSEGGVGSDFHLYNAAGQIAIQIDTNWNGGADSRIVVDELQIAGGSDLSEQFDVTAPRGDAAPGMVVCIDPANPGKLVVSTRAHDRTVAGIISGAGGVKPGMYMGQKGSLADGHAPVALTGRVYCFVDATNSPIQPGDLLTTSDTPGHAMKVTDHASAQGSILGKAMTGLDSGKGLVLVLVSLQ